MLPSPNRVGPLFWPESLYFAHLGLHHLPRNRLLGICLRCPNLPLSLVEMDHLGLNPRLALLPPASLAADGNVDCPSSGAKNEECVQETRVMSVPLINPTKKTKE